MALPPIGPMGRVEKFVSFTPFHGPIQYHAFPTNQGGLSNEYYEISQNNNHFPRHCPILHKYTPMLNTMYYDTFGSPSHNTNQCHALDALAERLDRSAFIVNEGP
jgi:hypothetical protein